MIVRLRDEKLKNILVYILLFFAAMNFQTRFSLFLLLAFAGVCFLQKSLKINELIFVYLLLSFLMFIYNSDKGVLSVIHFAAPTCSYLIGLNITSENAYKNNTDSMMLTSQKNGYVLLAIISLGSFAHFLLNFITNVGSSVGRNTNDIWTGTTMAATGQAALACLMLGFAVAMIFLPSTKERRVIGMLCVLLIMAYNLILSGRTLIIMLLVLCFVALMYPKFKDVTKSYKNKYYISMCGIFVAMIVIYVADIGGIRTYINNSLLFERFEDMSGAFVDNSARTNTKILFIKDALNHPFGGLYMRHKYGYAHDLLLDGYDEYGFLGLLLLLTIVFDGAIQLYRIVFKSTLNNEIKLVFLLVNIAVWLEFTVEPILAGMSWLFSCYCLINGCMSGMNRTVLLTQQISSENKG